MFYNWPILQLIRQFYIRHCFRQGSTSVHIAVLLLLSINIIVIDGMLTGCDAYC